MEKTVQLFAVMVDEKTKVMVYSIPDMFTASDDYGVIEVTNLWENTETKNVFVVIGSGIVQINTRYIIHKFYMS